MVDNFFVQLAIIIIVSAFLAAFSRFFKQPLILAYIITGLLLGPLFFNYISSSDTLSLFSQLGITILLFIVGLNMDFNILKKFGFISLITGLGQVIITFILGFFITKLLGFGNIEAFYIGIALTFSSTIIIIKLLSDKYDLNTLYGRITVGCLLIQDFIAIILLILISGLSTNQDSLVTTLGFTLLKCLGLIVFILLFSKYIAPYLFNKLAKTQELLFVSGLSWCFLVILLVLKMNFSIEIGSFLAGLGLGALPYSRELSNKLKYLRDFFIILFFVNLSLQVVISDVSSLIIPAIILSLFVLIGKPVIVMGLMWLFGYKSRTGVLAGSSLAQISEFSLILVSLGLAINHIGSNVVTLVTLVGIITIGASTYMILYSESVYQYFSNYLRAFERKKIREEEVRDSLHHESYHMILFGAHRAGYSVVKRLLKAKEKFLVVDYDPELITKLKRKEVDCLYGDISDPETLDIITSFNPKTVISTVPSLEDNLILLKYFKKNKNVVVIAVAKEVHDVITLYKAGADFVILPEIITGYKISDYLTHLDPNGIRRFGKKYYKSLLDDVKNGLI